MKIEITEEVYRKLQGLARPFEDTPNDVIFRLLSENVSADPERVGVPLKSSVVSGDLITKGGRVPAGTKLKAVYRSRTFTAEIVNSSVVWDGKTFSSLSEAAVAVIRSTGSNRKTEDGWRFWLYLDGSDNKWKPLDELRTSAGNSNRLSAK